MKVDFNNIIGRIKPLHAVNAAPITGVNTELFRHLQEAQVPYIRLHDMGVDFTRPKIDIPAVFPRFEADENDPASYDFEYTDHLIAELLRYGCKPFYRLGVTFENAVRQGFKPRHIKPPADFGKWARICEHIVRHYNEGWAEGFRYGIEYWEIWNEPENGCPDAPTNRANQGWSGTKEQYYALYAATAKHLKACFGDSIKVGGYGCCTMYGFFEAEEIPERAAGAAGYRKEFFYGFLDHIRAQNLPLDFFSWHTYWDLPHNLIMARRIREALDAHGYQTTEMILDEWNCAFAPEDLDTARSAASAAAMLLAMQDEAVDMMMYYKASLQLSSYSGLFDPRTKKPTCTLAAFRAFGALYQLGQQAECVAEEDGIYAVAATDGMTQGVMITNIGEDTTLATGLLDFEVYLIDAEHRMEKTNLNSATLPLAKDQTVYLKK